MSEEKLFCYKIPKSVGKPYLRAMTNLRISFIGGGDSIDTDIDVNDSIERGEKADIVGRFPFNEDGNNSPDFDVLIIKLFKP